MRVRHIQQTRNEMIDAILGASEDATIALVVLEESDDEGNEGHLITTGKRDGNVGLAFMGAVLTHTAMRESFGEEG